MNYQLNYFTTYQQCTHRIHIMYKMHFGLRISPCTPLYYRYHSFSFPVSFSFFSFLNYCVFSIKKISSDTSRFFPPPSLLHCTADRRLFCSILLCLSLHTQWNLLQGNASEQNGEHDNPKLITSLSFTFYSLLSFHTQNANQSYCMVNSWTGREKGKTIYDQLYKYSKFNQTWSSG